MKWTAAVAEKNEHIKNLIDARDKEVADRRDVAAAMAAQHQRGHAEDMRDAIILIQNAIESIDRALADEKRLAGLPTPGVSIRLKSSDD